MVDKIAKCTFGVSTTFGRTEFYTETVEDAKKIFEELFNWSDEIKWIERDSGIENDGEPVFANIKEIQIMKPEQFNGDKNGD